MKWLRNFTHVAKTLSLTLSATTMVMAPLAQGAEAAKASKMTPVKVVVDYSKYNWKMDKAYIQDFMKSTGLSGKKKMTVGEYYSKVRGTYPATMRHQMDIWVDSNRSEMMPDFQVSTFQDNQGKEQIRLQISAPGQSATISYAPDSTDKYVKFNNTYLARTDLLYPEHMLLKLAQGDKMIMKSLVEGSKTPLNRLKSPIKLGYQEFLRLSPRQRAEYMFRIRKLVESSEKVLSNYYGSQALNDFKKDFYVQWLLGHDAEAAESYVGKPCIVSGYISKYGENKSCGGTTSGKEHLDNEMKTYGGNCGSNAVSCNPLVYGFDSKQKSFCVNRVRSDIIEATAKNCGVVSQLRPNNVEDKKRIIESYLKSKGQNIDLAFNEEGKVSREQYEKVSGYLDELKDYVKSAVEKCESSPLKEIRVKRPDQDSACIAIAQRKIDLNAYDMLPLTPLVPGEIGSGAVACVLAAGEPLKTGCICEEPNKRGFQKDSDEEIEACIAPEAAAIVVKENEKCTDDRKKDEKTGECIAAAGFFSRNKGLIIGGAIGLGVLALFFGRGRHTTSTTTPAYVDPCGVAMAGNMALCHPPVVVPPTVTPPIQPPPITVVTPTPAPTVVPPVVVPPTPVIPVPIPTTTETTTNTNTSTSGGTR